MKRILAAALSAISAFFGVTAQPPHTSVEHPQWSRNAVIYEVNTRQYTPEGTFQAFRTHIPRLKDLGVDILWFMPIHPISELNRKGGLGSYYAVKDYKAVNPEFGTLDDFRKLVDDAHAAGMKVIIDWVPNHTGCDNAWVQQHPEYYKLNGEGKMYGPYDWTDVYQLDYSVPGTRAAMQDAMIFWLENAGIDGFRCDVAGMVPVDFWNALRPALASAAPDREIFMLAEASDANLLEHAFDMDYNWPMKDLFSHIAATQGEYSFGDGNPAYPEKHAEDIYALLEEQDKAYPVDGYMMQMTSNHDLNSWEGTEFQRLGKYADAFAALTYTLPGMPLIYTGQEAALNRALEFFVKDTPPQWGNSPTVDYKALNALKHSRPELAAGTAGGKVEKLATPGRDIIAFTRVKDGSATFFAANLGKETAAPVSSPVKFKDGRDAMTGKAVKSTPATLAPGEFIIVTYKAR